MNPYDSLDPIGSSEKENYKIFNIHFST